MRTALYRTARVIFINRRSFTTTCGLRSPPNSTYKPGFLMGMILSKVGNDFPSVTKISTTDVSTMLEKRKNKAGEDDNDTQLLLLDCRTRNEFEISHLDGAIHVPFDDGMEADNIFKQVAQLQNAEGKEIVCYCLVGYRASIVARKLEKEYAKRLDGNQPRIYSMEGSICKWVHEGRPLLDINNNKATHIHPFNSICGKLLDKSVRKTSGFKEIWNFSWPKPKD